MPIAPQPDAPQPLPAPAASRPAIAYLISRYPTLSMIFVLREVLALRALGFRIETASINPPDRPVPELTADEASEAARTYCVKRHGLPGALAAFLCTLAANPAGLLRGLALVLALGRLDLARLALNLMYFLEALMVGQWMRRNGLTHLHVHLASQAASVGLYVQRIFGYGYSLTVHGPDEFYAAQHHALTRKIAAARFIVCISSFARSQLMNLSPYEHWTRFTVVRLGVDPAHFDPAHFAPWQPPPQGREALPADGQHPFEILCIGRLTPAKGQHLLIDAVAQLIQRGRGVRLRLAGSGPDEASLRRHAASLPTPQAIVFEGAVNQDRIRSLYAAADLFCLPSFAEGIPVVLMEAMSMQIPCVSTHIAGIPELIRDGVDGLLVPPSDLEALTAALARLMDDPALRRALALSARDRILSQYDLRANIQQLAQEFIRRIGNSA